MRLRRWFALVLLALVSFSLLAGCTRKKKKVAPPPEVKKVVEPEEMTTSSKELVRRISGGELTLTRMVDPAKGLGWASYNVDLGSGRRLCGDNLAKSQTAISEQLKIIDKQNYTLDCVDFTCTASKGQWRMVFVFAFKDGMKLDAVSHFMHPVPDDFLDVRTEAATNATCTPDTFAVLDPKASDYCQTACARADACGALKTLKHTVDLCTAECLSQKENYKVAFCDPFVKDCVTANECISGKKAELPPLPQ